MRRGWCQGRRHGVQVWSFLLWETEAERRATRVGRGDSRAPGSVRLKPGTLLLHLLGHHEQHLAQALRQRGCQEGPRRGNRDAEARGPAACGEGPSRLPSPDAVLVAQGLRCPQLGVQVVVDAIHLTQGHPVPPAQWQRQQPQRHGRG